ncbi:MAG: hydroxyacid dehydrogenase [Motiliproteus sp.]
MAGAIKKVLVAGKVHPEGLRLLDERDDICYEMIDYPTAEDFIDKLPACDGLLLRTMALPPAALEASSKLKVISRHGVGYDNVPVELASSMGIPVAIIDNVNAVAVAEHTLFMMLALAKQCTDYDRAVRQGDWAIQNTLAATELWQKKVLLVGFGRIGFEVSKRLKAFDADVCVYDPYLPDEKIAEYGVTRVDTLTDGVRQADYISLHVPKTPETQNLFDAQMLGLMKPGAFLINTARGGLIDESALVDALQNKQIKGAGLDTVVNEPIPSDSPLVALGNLLLSPHSAGMTEECAARMGISSAKNVLAAFDGTLKSELTVNRSALS